MPRATVLNAVSLRRCRRERSTDTRTARSGSVSGRLRRALGRVPWLRNPRQQQEVAVDDRLGDLDEFVAVVLRVVAQHLERPVGVYSMAGHQVPLRQLDRRPAAERALQAVILGEALQRMSIALCSSSGLPSTM
jgi:hypothetical protein